MSQKSKPVFGFIFKALIESFQFFHVMICNGSVKVEPPLDALRHFEKPILGSGSVCTVSDTAIYCALYEVLNIIPVWLTLMITIVF